MKMRNNTLVLPVVSKVFLPNAVQEDLGNIYDLLLLR